MESVVTVAASIKRSGLVNACQCCPGRPYLELAVPREMSSVESLTVITTSHDQGYSNTQDAHRGTYNGSYTWFEVVAISPSNHERSPTRDVQRNLHASRERKRHVNVFDVRDDDETRRWLSAIRGGDTIQLIMRAEFPAWVNFCYEAELRVTGKVEDNQPPQLYFASSTPRESPAYYTALDQAARDIRVLAISPGAFDEPLRCTLQIMSLDDNRRQSYDALSYCWGGLRADKIITVNAESPAGDIQEHEVALTTTLFEALRHLRPETGSPKLLWVDFICINQGDLAERATQVGIMPKIYSRAETVHIWLGSSSPSTEGVLNAVRDIASRFEGRSSLTEARDKESIKRRHGPVFPGHPEDRMLGFVQDWRRCDFAWFRRTWVLQEVANARSAVVHCGRDTVPWSVFLRLADCFTKVKSTTGLFRYRYSIMPPIFASLFRIDNDSNHAAGVSAAQQQRVPGRGILEILVAGHDLDASDPRDKIFALLQFGLETAELERLPSLIRPDYTKPAARVFADFTRWWIAAHGSLRILSAVHTNRDRTWQQMSSGAAADLGGLDRPTWCFWHGGAASWAKATLGLSRDAAYRATGGSVPDAELLTADIERPLTLRLRGVHVCVIEDIKSYPLFRRMSASEMGEAFFRIFDPTGLQKTWIWNGDEQTVPVPRKPLEDQQVLRRLGEHHSAHLHHLKRSGGALPCYSPCYFRGVKDSGSFLGLCPHNARASDVVVMLAGGNVPYLLREVPDDRSMPGQAEERDEPGEQRHGSKSYHFIGECFLDGYMDGQKWQSLTRESENAELETFSLV